MGTVNQVRVVIESDAGIRVAELPLRDLGSARLYQAWRWRAHAGRHESLPVESSMRRTVATAFFRQRTRQNTASLL